MTKKLLFVTAEAMPFAATGGLGDVAGSLPAALKAQDPDMDVRVVMPLYGAVSKEWRDKMECVAELEVPLCWRRQYCGIHRLEKDGVIYYFIDNRYYFDRETLYGCFDDGERFAFFCRSVVEMMWRLEFSPDILHCNDWQTALLPIYCKHKFWYDENFQKMRTIFTIHNVEYQGQYDFAIFEDVFDLSGVEHSILDMDGCINLMKGAIVVSDCVSTVSPRYAQELQTPEISKKLCPILQANSYKMCGILNGIDYNYYNPKTDPVLASNFDAKTLSKKTKNKTELQKELGLTEDKEIPMIAIITRLASHKGLDLVVNQAYRLMNEQNVQLVILGCGETQYEQFFSRLQWDYPGRVCACLCYDRALSRRIYAACDLFLMPSKSEPCGLSQMICSRYGAIPIVRETGGLVDSIKPYYEEDGNLMGNGFTFYDYNAHVMYDRIASALNLWYNKEKRDAYVKQIMQVDFSWNRSAQDYMNLYSSLV
jgi:starch synthase